MYTKFILRHHGINYPFNAYSVEDAIKGSLQLDGFNLDNISWQHLSGGRYAVYDSTKPKDKNYEGNNPFLLVVSEDN